ncbi:MAG: hypothetical protein AUH99_12705 [Candidatus Rokubacteria bacterium 13_2_20CM_2_70_11]|nr:MAG: hypothetical protein AUH99_12705 [Candidatus Rokubacteria bacterium 13_2_20CM_2_70_11]
MVPAPSPKKPVTAMPRRKTSRRTPRSQRNPWIGRVVSRRCSRTRSAIQPATAAAAAAIVKSTRNPKRRITHSARSGATAVPVSPATP